MKFLNYTICQKLEKLGLKSESKFYWQKQKTWFAHQFEPRNKKHYLAYSLSDLLHKDNLKILFGGKKIAIHWHMGEFADMWLPAWQHCSHKLLEAYWQSWKELENYLEEKL